MLHDMHQPKISSCDSISNGTFYHDRGGRDEGQMPERNIPWQREVERLVSAGVDCWLARIPRRQHPTVGGKLVHRPQVCGPSAFSRRRDAKRLVDEGAAVE